MSRMGSADAASLLDVPPRPSTAPCRRTPDSLRRYLTPPALESQPTPGPAKVPGQYLTAWEDTMSTASWLSQEDATAVMPRGCSGLAGAITIGSSLPGMEACAGSIWCRHPRTVSPPLPFMSSQRRQSLECALQSMSSRFERGAFFNTLFLDPTFHDFGLRSYYPTGSILERGTHCITRNTFQFRLR